MTRLTDVSTHYEFGRNWSDFARTVSDAAIEEAIAGLARLCPAEEIAGRDVLDIGCGSGLPALAALRLGAASVTALDIDENSVATTRDLLTRHAPAGAHWSANVRSVFDLGDLPKFPVVYSWGVLHHTGDMRRAITCAADRVAPGGALYLALYRRTPMCRAWTLEKRLYTAAPGWARRVIEAGYAGAFRTAMALTGRSFRDYVDNYVRNRGMSWMTDVRDWLGGYPYESISEADMLALAEDLRFVPIRRFCREPGLGLFGTGCDEYAFRRMD